MNSDTVWLEFNTPDMVFKLIGFSYVPKRSIRNSNTTNVFCNVLLQRYNVTFEEDFNCILENIKSLLEKTC